MFYPNNFYSSITKVRVLDRCLECGFEGVLDRWMDRDLEGVRDWCLDRDLERVLDRCLDRDLEGDLDRCLDRDLVVVLDRCLDRDLVGVLDRCLDRDLVGVLDRCLDRDLFGVLDRCLDCDLVGVLDRCLDRDLVGVLDRCLDRDLVGVLERCLDCDLDRSNCAPVQLVSLLSLSSVDVTSLVSSLESSVSILVFLLRTPSIVVDVSASTLRNLISFLAHELVSFDSPPPDTNIAHPSKQTPSLKKYAQLELKYQADTWQSSTLRTATASDLELDAETECSERTVLQCDQPKDCAQTVLGLCRAANNLEQVTIQHGTNTVPTQSYQCECRRCRLNVVLVSFHLLRLLPLSDPCLLLTMSKTAQFQHSPISVNGSDTTQSQHGLSTVLSVQNIIYDVGMVEFLQKKRKSLLGQLRCALLVRLPSRESPLGSATAPYLELKHHYIAKHRSLLLKARNDSNNDATVLLTHCCLDSVDVLHYTCDQGQPKEQASKATAGDPITWRSQMSNSDLRIQSACKACCKFRIGRGKEEVMSAHHRPSSLVPGNVQAAACITAGVSVNCQDDIGSTPLHIAAAYGRVELVDALVREGAEIDRPNNFGWTPIMQAARNGQSTVAIKLMNNGVNVNLKNKLGANLLALAVASNDEKTITAVINDMSHKIVDLSLDPLPLVIASLQGFTDVVSTLLKKGFNPNTATSCTGLTALMMASYNGHYSVAEQLLKNNCDPEITNCINQNALDIAFEMGHEKIQSLLTKKTKADPAILPSIPYNILVLPASILRPSTSRQQYYCHWNLGLRPSFLSRDLQDT
uniref:Uncharacterized protein n=1 Tax=Timema monikensis TaxID=170555 RepID=A0A7R9E677_9NEOP|nr:unnamed protein product [Timema monikensis]